MNVFLTFLLAVEPRDENRLAEHVSVHRREERLARVERVLRRRDVDLRVERVQREGVVMVRSGRRAGTHVALAAQALLLAPVRQVALRDTFSQPGGGAR